MKANMMKYFTLILLIAAFACSKKEETTVDPEPAEQPPVAEPVEPAEPIKPTVEPDPPAPTDAEILRHINMEDVYFDFDKATLRDDAKATLERHAEVLKANPRVQVLVEGHCDERGTDEYNFALGERRAERVRSYLVSLGIDASPLRTVSYGERNPAAMGSNEDAWAKNRRGHFALSVGN